MNLLNLFVLLLSLLCRLDPCACWDQAELDLFDLVEEIGENFYDVLHVDQVSFVGPSRRYAVGWLVIVKSAQLSFFGGVGR